MTTRRPPDELEKDDAPVTAGEQARAEAFGRLVDGLLAGDPLPPAMDSDDRALVEAATVVMASSRAIEPAPERTRRLVDQALEAAILRRGGAAASDQPAAPMALVPGGGGEEDPNERSVTDVTTRRRRRSDQVARVLPWAVASLAAAAAIVLYIARPPHRDRAGDETAEVAPAPAVDDVPRDVTHTSRPADPLVGPIGEAERGKATQRIDLLYADRMSGYRDLVFRRALPQEVDR
ncbi:MAG TPA: hypothetical protein VFU21_02130 [Kofleriaceae bacterium]|nr:hypothetical protein [Kofleriaceae bacterium]